MRLCRRRWIRPFTAVTPCSGNGAPSATGTPTTQAPAPEAATPRAAKTPHPAHPKPIDAWPEPRKARSWSPATSETKSRHTREVTSDVAGVSADLLDPAVVLSGTDWGALQHGMGSAEDTPQMVAALFESDQAVRS